MNMNISCIKFLNLAFVLFTITYVSKMKQAYLLKTDNTIRIRDVGKNLEEENPLSHNTHKRNL